MYTLVPIASQNEASQEGQKLQHAIGVLYPSLRESGTLLYSLRQDDEPVLSMSVRYDDQGIYHCSHVVGLRNRRPTQDELDVLYHLLGAQKIALRYDPNTPS